MLNVARSKTAAFQKKANYFQVLDTLASKNTPEQIGQAFKKALGFIVRDSKRGGSHQAVVQRPGKEFNFAVTRYMGPNTFERGLRGLECTPTEKWTLFEELGVSRKTLNSLQELKKADQRKKASVPAHFSAREAAVIQDLTPGDIFVVHEAFVSPFGGARIPLGTKLRLDGWHKPSIDTTFVREEFKPEGMRVRFDLVDHPDHMVWLTMDQFYNNVEPVDDYKADDEEDQNEMPGPSLRVTNPNADTVVSRRPKRAENRYPLRVKVDCKTAEQCARARSIFRSSLGVPEEETGSKGEGTMELGWYYEDESLLDAAMDRIEDVRLRVEAIIGGPFFIKAY